MWNDNQLKLLSDWIQRVEGGYVNNPHDPGGETKYGISKRQFPDLDIKNLTIQDAMKIYYQKYWAPFNLDSYKFPLAVVLFDCNVLCGPGKTKIFLDDTKHILGAMAGNQDLFVIQLLSERIEYHTKDVNFNYFGRGWISRVEELMKFYVRLRKIYNT